VHDKGGSSHLAVGPHGEVVVRIAPIAASGNELDEGVDLVAVSLDGGVTWQKTPAPGDRDWPSASNPRTTPRWVEPLAWDSAGALFSFWVNRSGVWLARSRDNAASWTTWKVGDATDLSYYPYLTARGNGDVAATWFSGLGPSWRAHVARIRVSENRNPVLVEAPPLRPDSWGLRSRRENPDTRSAGGEYLPVVFLRDGSLAVVSPIQNERAQLFGFTYWRWRER
jgi:hypothetical protein